MTLGCRPRLACATAVLLLTACGGSSNSDGSTGSTALTTTPTGSSAPRTSTDGTTSTAPPRTTTVETTAPLVDDREAITATFVAFFDGAVRDVDAKVAELEHGEALRSMLDDAVADPQFAQMSTQVSSVTTLDAAGCQNLGLPSPCAEVVHDLLVGQFPALIDNTAHAVQIDGEWKVAAETWCRIVTIGGAECPPL